MKRVQINMKLTPAPNEHTENHTIATKRDSHNETWRMNSVQELSKTSL